jgi:hypothetical protein
MKRWLRGNLVGLIAIVLLVPATVAITFANEMGAYNQSRPTEALSLGPGDYAEFGDARWELENVRRISWSSTEGVDADLPNATELVVVTIEVTPLDLDEEGLSTYCMVQLDEMDGESVARSWNDATFDGLDYRTSEGSESSCVRELTEPYLLESIFVVPSDAGDELAMQVQVESELPRYLSLRLS